MIFQNVGVGWRHHFMWPFMGTLKNGDIWQVMALWRYNHYQMHYENKEILSSLYTYHCLIEVVAKTGLTNWYDEEHTFHKIWKETEIVFQWAIAVVS